MVGLWGVFDVVVEVYVDDEYDTSEVADAFVVACKGFVEFV